MQSFLLKETFVILLSVLCLLESLAFHIHHILRPPASVRTLSSNNVAAVGPLFMAGRQNNRKRYSQQAVKVKAPPMNDEIQQTEMRVVTPNPGGKDEPLGVMTREEALAKAKEMGNLDLILINANSDPPVCKIVNYSKYRYDQEKKKKDVKKNSKATELKEVKMSYKIDVHDYGVRKKNAAKFINQGNRVKCTVTFRGREVQHDKLGFDLLEKLSEELGDIAMKENKPKREGRFLSQILGPRPEVVKAINERKRNEEKAKKKKKAASLEEKKAKDKAAAATAAATKTKQAEASGDEIKPNGSGTTDLDVESSLDDLLGADDFADVF